MTPNPMVNPTREPVRTTPSASAVEFLDKALEYKLVVAMFKKLKNHVKQSKRVVAGPRAASSMLLVAARPTKAVSTRDKRGPLNKRPKQGRANLR